MSVKTEVENAPSGPRVVWGMGNIAREIGTTERKAFHMAETGRLPGAKKIAGRWAFLPEKFFEEMVA